MKTMVLKVARIGNSRGVRLPAALLRRYGIGDSVIMEERSDGILLRPNAAAPEKLSWKDTAEAMAGAGEDWSEWDTASGDGLEAFRWPSRTVPQAAETPARYGRGRRGGKSS